MKRLTLLSLLMAFMSMAYAQSADGRYTSRMTQDGTLIFINPKKINKLHNIRHFDYDMTLLSWTDSTTINFTFETDIMQLPEDFTIVSGEDVFTCKNYSPLFIDIKKKHYEIRITSKFPNNEISKIFESEKPPIFSFTQKGIAESATYSENAWRKDRKKLLDIYKLYLYSK